MDKRKITLTVIGVAVLLVVLVGSTYAYWTLNGAPKTSANASIQTGGLILRLDDTEGSITTNDVIDPNHLSFSKYFSITNESAADGYAKILFKGLTNTFVSDALVYDLEEVQSDKTSYATPRMIVTNEVLPKVSNSNATLVDALLIEKGTVTNNTVTANTKYYKITVRYKYSETVDQSEDIGKTLVSGFTLEESQYKGPIVMLNTGEVGETPFTVTKTGYYKLETWGAQGGSAGDYIGGYGGYSIAYLHLNNDNNLFINIGGQGQSVDGTNKVISGGYNGGGDGGTNSTRKTLIENSAGAGGGATHIATITKSNETGKTGELKYLEDYKGTLVNNTYYESDTILIVAGGGGGALLFKYNNSDYSQAEGGSGGGQKGNIASNSYSTWGLKINGYSGGTQIDSGYGIGGGSITQQGTNGSFGQGGTFVYNDDARGAGAGGGFFGGGGGFHTGAGGGSGYIASSTIVQNTSTNIVNKMYCYDCEESSELKTYTVSTHGTTTHENERDLTNCPNGYSENAISKCAKSGNGHARITYCGPNYNNC